MLILVSNFSTWYQYWQGFIPLTWSEGYEWCSLHDFLPAGELRSSHSMTNAAHDKRKEVSPPPGGEGRKFLAYNRVPPADCPQWDAAWAVFKRPRASNLRFWPGSPPPRWHKNQGPYIPIYISITEWHSLYELPLRLRVQPWPTF